MPRFLDSTGATVVKYKYDAWGNSLTVVSDVSANDIAELNPFRYRGYYFDTETGLYFLKTRYYDPEIGRFLTIDDISYLDPDSINGLNLYAYCGNNPVMNVDPNGNAWWNWVLSGVALVAGVALCFVPGAQAAGVSLIVAGATSMASNIMSAAGVDGKTASMISNWLSIVGGAVLCCTPFASIGASMIGSGVGGLIGGAITESAGVGYELGSAIGNILGGFLGGAIYKGLVNSGAISFKTSIKNLNNNPTDPYTDRFIGPKQNAVTEKIKMIEQTGRYEAIAVTRLSKGSYQVENGHHTLRALISLGKRFVWVRFTK